MVLLKPSEGGLLVSLLDEFANRIEDVCSKREGQLTIEQARTIIREINDFLYVNKEGLGTTFALGMEFPYFSEFHKYWEENHKEILNLQINKDKCEHLADILHDVYCKTKGRVFKELYNTNGLSDEEVCRVRLLTANQDFRGSRNFEELAKIYKNDPDIFSVDFIVKNPERFLQEIKITDLSQTDKRIKYAKTISQFLIERNTSPYGLISYYKNDVYSLRQALVNCVGAGYGNKKTDMFIRDMIILGIWKSVKGFDKIDVASDVNTIKVALRTGILSSDIPLLSSFLDIFCYQYGYVDEMNAKAWRTVWEIWNDKYEESIESPSLLDYFIYRIVGKEFCKENLFTYQCDNGHFFLWNTRGKSVCPTCKGRAKVVKGQYMCDSENGSIVTTRILPEYSNCPFKKVCDKSNCKNLQSPKSISILGKTGWDSAYTNINEGGGGLMA